MTPPIVQRGSLQERLWFRFTALHMALYRRTGARIGGRMFGAPILLLDHLGRRSGTQRTTPLIYLADGPDLVIVASYGGAPQHPSWWLNLADAPETSVLVGSERRRVRAHEAAGEERERLWPRLVELYPDYAAYAARTERQIPVVVLEPAG